MLTAKFFFFSKKLDASKFYIRDKILQKRILDFSLLLQFLVHFYSIQLYPSSPNNDHLRAISTITT